MMLPSMKILIIGVLTTFTRFLKFQTYLEVRVYILMKYCSGILFSVAPIKFQNI